MKHLKTNEGLWSNLFKKKPEEKKPELTIAEMRQEELSRLSEFVKKSDNSIGLSKVYKLEFTGDIPKGTPNKGRFWYNYSELSVKFKRSYIEELLAMGSSDLDLNTIIGDHEITGKCLWDDEEKNIDYIKFGITFKLNGEFRGVGGYSDVRIFKKRREDDNYYIHFESARIRKDDEPFEEFIAKSLYSLKYELLGRLRRINIILKESIERLEKDRRKKELEKKIDPIRECFYELVDMSSDHNIFVNQAEGMTCDFDIRGIEVIKQKKPSGEWRYANRYYNDDITFDEAHIRLNDKLMTIFNILMEAKPRINDIVDGAKFDMELKNGKIRILIS